MRAPLRLGAATALAALIALTGLVAPAAAAAPADRGPSVRAAAAPLIPLMRKDRTRAQRLTASLTSGSALVAAPAPGPVLSTWQVAYTGFDAASTPNGPAAQAAFQAAVDIWSRLVASPVPIKVQASFAALPPGVLGSAGASSYYSLGGQSWLPSALADAVHGSDVAPLANGPGSDITAQFTNVSSAGFSFSTTGSTPSGSVDFMSVVMHEIGHGLGFAGSLDVSGGLGSYGAPLPDAYDRFAYDAPAGGASVLAHANSSADLAGVLQSGSLWWNGAQGVAGGGGTRPRLYAPASWEGGSSFSHLDESTYGFGNPNSLMTPSISSAEVIHDPGPITLGMLRDLGWQTAAPVTSSVPDAPTGVTAARTPGAGGSADVSWQPANPHGSPVTGYTVTASTGQSASSTGTSATLTGLANGASTTFRVTALSAAGPSGQSSPSAVVVPGTVPTAVAAVTASAGDGLALVQWSAAAANGYPVTAYTVTASPGGIAVSTSSTSATLTGLSNGTAYAFSVTAANALGTSTATTSPTVVPATIAVPLPTLLPDLLAPVLSLVSTPAPLTRSTTATFAFNALDDHPSPSVLCALDGGPTTTCPASYALLADGAHRLVAVARDAAGNTSLPVLWSWTVDTTAPSLAMAAAPPFVTSTTSPISWSAADRGSGVASYRVRARRAPWNGGFGGWSSPVATTSPRFAAAAPRGWTTCTSVLAVDRAGNASPWSTERCSTAPLDDRAVGGTGSWRRLSSLATWLGTFSRATSTGSRMALPHVVGRRVGLVVTTCPTCGSVTVAFGGTVRTLGLVSSTTRYRVLLSVDTGALRAGTVTVTTRSSRAVLVDGLGVSRT